jgi:hypothetical protein
MSEENYSESDVSVLCRYSYRVKKYVGIINSDNLSNIKMTFTLLTAVDKSNDREIGFRGLF